MRLDLYWIPLGAGDRAGQGVVRFFGRLFEAVSATLDRRHRCDLFHAALVATTADGETISIEMAPIPDANGRAARGVVAEGAVGSKWLGRLRIFRYEIRRWKGGVIPDLGFAVASPVRIASDPTVVDRVLGLLPRVPAPVWGRDELATGDMWNSNSVVSWTLAQSGLDQVAGEPPHGGRAPGWAAGIEAVRRQRLGDA